MSTSRGFLGTFHFLLALVLAMSLSPGFACAKGPGANAYQGSDENQLSLLGDASDPSFDLRNEGVVPSVKNQNPWGTPWAFGVIATSEVSIMSELGLTATDDEVDLSELHLAWFAYTPLPASAGSQAGEGIHTVTTTAEGILDQGGLPYTGTSVLSSGVGPLLESDLPYKNKEGHTVDDGGTPLHYAKTGDWSVAENLRFSQALQLKNSSVLPNPKGLGPLGEYVYNESGTQAIKSELAAGRAVKIAYHADTYRPGQLDPPKYITLDNWAHYTYENVDANHTVTIMGWDDTYSKSNFLTGHQPPADGAWIVKNSWGSSSPGVSFPHHTSNGWGVNGEGYFYLSYYDQSLATPESFTFFTEEYGQSAKRHLIDQNDFMPSSGVTAVQFQNPTMMANVFEASEHQMVRSLSCETAGSDTTVTYKLYRLNDGYTNPEDGTLLTILSETYTYGGYHRAQLGEGFEMDPGQHYSVVVMQRTGPDYEVVYDRSLNEAGMRYVNEVFPGTNLTNYAVGVINGGESFLSDQGGWNDWAGVVAVIKQGDPNGGYGPIYDYDNFPIKAYADLIEDPQIVSVPDLSNMTEAEARAALERLGLSGQVGEPEYSDTIEAGHVVRQEPPAGTSVTEGASVTYYLSLGKAPGPDEPEPDPKTGSSEATGSASSEGGGGETGDSSVLFTVVLAAVAAACLGAALANRPKNHRSR